jgi:hypothetical protein
MDLADEAGRTGAYADAVSAATVPDLTRTDAEVVFVACHEATIGSRNASGKRESADVVE